MKRMNFTKLQRLFIGIRLSDKLQSQIEEWHNQYMELVPIRWIKPQNLHITLIPPWQDDTRTVIPLLQQIRNTTGPFTLQFSKVASGPKNDRPRLIWAYGEPSLPLLQLKTKLDEILKDRVKIRRIPLKIVQTIETITPTAIPDRNKLFMHITLAKISLPPFSGKMKVKEVTIKPFSDAINWQEQVNTITLYASHLQKNGADYEELDTIEL